jgi:cell division protein FtsQ
MPAVVRGGRRQANVSKAASKKTASASKRKSRAAPARGPARKLHALKALSISNRATAWAVVGLLLFGAALVLFTHGRAQAMAQAASRAFDGRLAAMGLRLERVRLDGASAEAAPAIKQALDLRKDEPITALDLAALRRKVEEVGWVRRARITRLLPDTLVVSVEERERLAVWQHNGRTAVIDPDGRPIKEADPGRFTDLPLVVGQGADQAAGRILPLVRQRPRLMARLEALVRVEDRRWDLRLKDGSLIQLPAQGEEAALLQLDQLDQKGRVLDLGFSRVDLRDPEMAAVRPKGDATPAPPAAGAGG